MASKEVKAGAAYVELFVKDNKLSAGLRAASARIKKWAASTKKMMQSIGTSLMNFGTRGLMLGGAVGGGLFAMAKSFADTGDAVEKMSHRTGMSAEALSELGYAAQLCGTDIGTLEGSIHKMQMLMLEAGRGSKAAVEKLSALGLSFGQLAKLSPEDQFAAIVERLGQMNEADRAAHAMNLLGKSAHQLMPLINAGTKGIAEMRAEARRLGISMSGEDAQAAAELTDALTRVQTAMKGIVNHIGAALAPELTSLVNWTVNYTKSLVEIIKRNRTLIVSIAKWSAIIAGVSAGVIALGAAFWGFGMVAGSVLGAIAVSLSLVAGLITFLISPIGMLVTAIAAVAWHLGDIGTAIEWLKETWASLFSTATKAWGGICDAIAAGRIDLAMKVAWSGIKLVWTDGINFLYKWWLWVQKEVLSVWDATVWALGSVWNGVIYGLQTGWNWFQRFIMNAFHGVQAAWTMAVKGISDTWSWCMTGFLNAWDWAYTQVAKGLAWIYAKLTGMDAEAMVRIVEEDHVARQQNRNASYDQSQKERDEQYQNNMAAIGQKNLDFKAQMDASQKAADAAYTDRQNATNAAYIDKDNARQSNYEKQLAGLEADRLQAEQEFNDAVAEAAEARAAFEPDAPVEWNPAKLPDFGEDIAEAIEDAVVQGIDTAHKTVSGSSTGTFNTAALRFQKRTDSPIIQHLESIAANTGQSAKYTKQQYQETKRIGFSAVAR